MGFLEPTFMKKRKLELKDIAGYLPYGMLFQEQRDHAVLRMDSIESRNCYEIWAAQKYIRGVCKDVNDINYPYLSAKKCSGQGFRLSDIKPILHPMSDLIHSIAVKGYNKDREFIPLIEMAKYDSGNEGKKYTLERDPDPDYADWYVTASIESNEGPYIYSFNRDVRYQYASLWELDFLNRWMFDYRGLIDDNLAINVNYP